MPAPGQPGYGAMSLKDMLGGDLSGLGEVEGPALGVVEFVAEDGSLVVEFEDDRGTKTTEVTLGNVTTRTVTENNGTVTVMQLEFDPATGFTTETDLGSGSRQESQFETTEIVNVAGVGEVKTVDYNMFGVETETTTSDTGVVTEVNFDARGRKITTVTNADKSGTVSELSPDGKVDWVTTVGADGSATVQRMEKGTDGTWTANTDPSNIGTAMVSYNGDISSYTTVDWGNGTSTTREINYETKVDKLMHYDDVGSYLSEAVYSTLADGSIDRQSTWANGDFEQHKYSVLDDGALSHTIAGDDGEIFKVTITSYDADNTETKIVNYRTDNRTDVGTYVDGVEMEYIETFTADTGTGNMKGDVVTYSFDPDSLETTQIFVNADGTSQVYTMDADAVGKVDFSTSERLGDGTHSTTNGTLTLDLTLDAGGRLTRATDDSGREVFTEYDSSDNVIEVEEIYVDNDGALVTKVTEGSVSKEEVVNEDGSKTVREVNTATGAISETNVDAKGVSTVKAATGTIDASANTVTFDVTVGSNTVTKTINLSNGNEVEVVKDGSDNILSTTTTTEDAAGNEVILEVLADGASTETVINEKGDSQVTAITADNIVTVSEIAKLADGSTATKVLGSGTVAEVNGNSVLTLELADGTSLTESTNISSGAVSATVEDEFGNVRAEDASGNVTFVDDDGVSIEATEFKSEIDLDYEGTGSDDEYHAGEAYVFDFTAGSLMSDENYDPNATYYENHDDGNNGSSTYYASSGINAVRPEYNWDDDIPMLSDFA